MAQQNPLPAHTVEAVTPPSPSPALQAAPQAVKRSMPAALSVMLGLVGAVFIIWFFTKLVWLILLIYLSFLFATILDLPVSRFESLKIPRGLSSTVIMLAIVGLVITAFFIAGNAAYQQVEDISATLQKLPDRVNDWVAQFRAGHPAFNELLQDFDAHKMLGEIAGTQPTMAAAKGLLAGAGTGFEILFSSVVLFFITLYLTIYGRDYLTAGRRLLPQHMRLEATRVAQNMASAHSGWFFASLANVCSASILNSVGLWLCGIPAAVILGIVAGLGELVPNVGPGVAAIPALLVTLVIAPDRFLLVVLMFAIVQTIQGYGISPHVMKHGVALPPLVTIIAVLVMGTLFGVLGVLVAIPLTADMVVLWNYFNGLAEKDPTDYDQVNGRPQPATPRIPP